MALTRRQKRLLIAAKEAAREIGEQGKALTPIIGELTVCDLLDLTWAPSDGFDATSKGGTTYQIKARRPQSRAQLRSSARMGRFRKKAGYQFKTGIFIVLDPDWDPKEIWRLPKARIIELESKKSESSGIHVGTFRREGRLVWQAGV